MDRFRMPCSDSTVEWIRDSLGFPTLEQLPSRSERESSDRMGRNFHELGEPPVPSALFGFARAAGAAAVRLRYW